MKPQQPAHTIFMIRPISGAEPSPFIRDNEHFPRGGLQRFQRECLSTHRQISYSASGPMWCGRRRFSGGFRTRSSVCDVHVRKPLDEKGGPLHIVIMDLDHDACYRAVSLRDSRFDGRFFTGVKTTGIYCRPICPARTPHSKNVTFFPTAAAAQERGFRPCLRCRPETAPDLGAWRGTSNTVSRALALIELGVLNEASVDDLAERLGVGERQLRRLFRQHLGASPVAVAQTRRILLAKQLIHETRLPMAEIDLLLRYHPPYDWTAMLEFLRRRAIPGVECVTEDRYARSIELDGEQ